MTGAARFGSTSTSMMRTSLAPSDRAASTYSRSRIASVCPRTMRPTAAQEKNAITRIDTVRLGPTTLTRATAKSRKGKDSTTSMNRARNVSTAPPW
jgi:hypothetical protein